MRKRVNTGVVFWLAAAIIMGLACLGVVYLNSLDKNPISEKPDIQLVQQKWDKKKSAVWISFLEFDTILRGKTQNQYEKEIDIVLTNMKNMHLNTAIVHVRPFGDAIYESKLFPWSYYCTGEQGKNPGFDPFAIFIKKAKAQNIKVEAWINPYRIKAPERDWKLSKTNPAVKDKSLAIQYNGGLYYDPASAKARKLIVDGVKEIVQKYEISAIHFDDYFYPTPDSKFDQKQYESFTKRGGKLKLEDFRRQQVDLLVKEVYKTVKQTKQDVEFGISPQGNNSNNQNTQFANIGKWVKEDGYIDYIAPQIYWGFEHEMAPFKKKVEEWEQLVKNSKVQLYIGIAVYRVGEEDTGAGSGAKEWINNSNVLARQVNLLKTKDKVQGCFLFRYQYIFQPQSKVKSQLVKERVGLQKQLER